MPAEPQILSETGRRARSWQRSLAAAIRDPDELVSRLSLPETFREPARCAARDFPLLVPESFLRRMQRGDPHDPLLRQVLPLDDELRPVPGFVQDAVGDLSARQAPGLLQKYQGRALLVATGSCAVHCRYCFRRYYPYHEDPKRLEDWNPALEAITADRSLTEVILSGGDPLMLNDTRLAELVERLAGIPHLRRLRIHSRLPIVLPDRVTESLLDLLSGLASLQSLVVVHANHPAEIAGDCTTALKGLVRAGIPTLNQAVLLRGVNDEVDVLAELCERLVNLGVLPYYLHQLDPVAGAAHFQVADRVAIELVSQLRERLPGYAVPQLVQEFAGDHSKRPLTTS